MRLSVLALYGEANVLYLMRSQRQNSTRMTLLKHQNTKTALFKYPKNDWVIALVKILVFTVFLDHPLKHKIL